MILAAGAMIWNTAGELLIVKPSYRNHWLIPGGIGERDESPRAACIREVHEEVGLAVEALALRCVDHKPATGDRPASLQFIFDAGKISDDQMSAIRVDGHEITEFKFLPPSDALPWLSDPLASRLGAVLASTPPGHILYLEDGEPA